MMAPHSLMKKALTPLAVLFLAVMMPACHRGGAKNGAQGVTTQTIAPAAAKPDATGSGDAMTQTVDVDDSRSEADGGVNAPASGTAPAKAKAATGKKKHK